MEEFLNAARVGDVERLEALLAADPAVLNARNEMGQSAIVLAQYHRQRAAVEFLLSRGPELTLHEACAVGALDRVKSIAGGGSRVIDTHAPDGFTPLALACFFGNTEVASYLVNQGANMNLAAANAMRVAPIHAAVAGRHKAIIELLVRGGADVNQRQHGGYTPLHAAAQNGDEDTVRLLLAHGADRDVRAENNQSALDFALGKGHAGVVAILESHS